MQGISWLLAQLLSCGRDRIVQVGLPPGYRLRSGSSLERSLLLKFMQRTYAEVEPGGNYAHLATTVDHYLSPETPLWWVELEANQTASGLPSSRSAQPVGCLWVGTAVDEAQGDRHAHVFLVYIAPEHRQQGLGTVLMQCAESWARQRGDRQIGLQVFRSNEAALNLYQKQGFQTHSLWMVKPLT